MSCLCFAQSACSACAQCEKKFEHIPINKHVRRCMQLTSVTLIGLQLIALGNDDRGVRRLQEHFFFELIQDRSDRIVQVKQYYLPGQLAVNIYIVGVSNYFVALYATGSVAIVIYYYRFVYGDSHPFQIIRKINENNDLILEFTGMFFVCACMRLQ